MKKYILIAILVGGLTACKGTKEASSASKNNNSVSVSNGNGKDAVQSKSQTADNGGSQSKDTVDVNTKNLSNDTNPAGVVSQINGSTGAMGNAQMSPNVSSEVTDVNEIYENLQMTDDQIENYEKSMKDFKETVKNDAHGEMRGTIGNEQERQLKKILTEDQWNKYREWKKNRK